MAQHFSKAIAEIVKAARTEKLLFCFDFDGTLAPIRRQPQAVRPSTALIAFLHKAAKVSSCKVAIISGRSLKDLRRRISVPGIVLIGSHGLESSSRVLSSSLQSKKLQPLLVQWRRALKKISGVTFERKPFSFVLHYRECSKKNQQEVVHFFIKAQPDLLQKCFQWMPAHKAFEIFAEVRGSKEHAVQDLLGKMKNARLIVAGDDVTDDGMLALGDSQGWAVAVGASRAGVKYFVKGPGELVNFLSRIISEKTK